MTNPFIRRIGLCLFALLLFLALTACEKLPTQEELYEAAQQLLESGEFQKAREAFAALGEYADAAVQVAESWIAEGKEKLENGAFAEARAAFENAKDRIDVDSLIRKAWYLEGEWLLTAGDLEGARAAFVSAGEYEDAGIRIQECDYRKAQQLLEGGDLDAAEAAFDALSGYRDAADCADSIRYQKAEALLASGEYRLAADAFAALGEYKDAAERQAEITGSFAYRWETLRGIAVGERIEWGAFEQDNDLENGPEPILWRVLSIEDGRALLISEYNLDCRMFNEPFKETRWDNCSLSKWLNGAFWEESFTEQERQKIALCPIAAEGNTEYGVRGGKDTEDHVFVLSLTEAQTLFADNADRIGVNTPYATARGAYTEENGAGWWWLRTPGYTTIFTAIVLTDGEASSWGTFYGYNHRAVRPSIVLDLNQEP